MVLLLVIYENIYLIVNLGIKGLFYKNINLINYF